MHYRLTAAIFAFLAAALVGCGKNDVLQVRAAASAKPAVPLAMLPRDIVPEHYRLALTIKSGEDGVQRVTEIDAEVVQPQRSYFMDGLDLRIHRTVARLPSGAEISVEYRQIFVPKQNELEGVRRVLKENEERIARCITFNAAKGAEINAAARGDQCSGGGGGALSQPPPAPFASDWS